MSAFHKLRVWSLAGGVCAAVVLGGWDTVGATPADTPPAPARLAVLAADGAAETATLADLLTVRLTETPGVETVERAELDRVLREQALTAAGLADGVRGRIAVGRLLRADGFLFVARTATRRQFAARLVEARRGFQVVQMLYATNEAPATVAENIAGAVTAKLPTLRLADDKRILLNVIRLGNATLDSRAGWIETDGITMLSGYLAAHPAVLAVERRELGTLLDETLARDANGPAFRAADFLLDGDVFLTPDADRESYGEPVTLVLRLRDMQLAEHARVTRRGRIDDLEDLLSEAATEILKQAAIRRPAVEGTAQLESRFLRGFDRFGVNGYWAAQSAYALDATNAAARRALVTSLLRHGKAPAQSFKAYMENAQFLSQAVSFIEQDPELRLEEFITPFPMPPVLDTRDMRENSRQMDWENDRELQELLQPVRARARFEMERHLLPHVGWYPVLCKHMHLMFEDQSESSTFLQTLVERSANDSKLKPIERQKHTAVLLSCTTLPPRLYDNLCTNGDPVIRFFTHVKASRISATTDERWRHNTAALELLPDVLRCTQLAAFFAEWHSRYDGDQQYNFLHNAIAYVRGGSVAAGALSRSALMRQFEVWLDAGDLAALCDTWSDQYFGWFDQPTADALLDRIQMVRQKEGVRLPKSEHGNRALDRIGKACLNLARRRQETKGIARGDKLVMLSPRDSRLPQLGYPVQSCTFAVTPQRLLVDGDHLWIAVGGHNTDSLLGIVTEYTGLLRMDLKSGQLALLCMEKFERKSPKGEECYSNLEYHALSPLFFWNRHICFAKRGRGVFLFPRDEPVETHGLKSFRLLNAQIGLPSVDITSATVLGDTLYIALPNTLLAWQEGSAQARVVTVTATETATGVLASTGLIDGLAADSASNRLYLFAERTIWRYMPTDNSWAKLAEGDRRVSTSRDGHGIITSTPGLVLFTRTRPSGRGFGGNIFEAFVDTTGCFRLADETIGPPPAELATPEAYLARYDLVRYRHGTIVIGGNYFTPGTPPDWELAYLVGATNTVGTDMAWLVPPSAPKAPPPAPSGKAASPAPTPIVAAVLANDSDGLTRLLNAGACIDEYGEDGMTPLSHAAANGKEAVLGTLIRCGAYIDVPNCKGRTPLMLASQNGHLRCVNMLLDAGADSRHRDNQGRPILQVSGDPGILRALMEAGANPLAPDSYGHIPVDNSIAPDIPDIKEMLWLGTIPGALKVNRRPSPIRPASHPVHTSRVDRALARLRQGGTLPDAERNACLIAFARYHTEVHSRQKYMYARRFPEPERTEYYLQAVKMGFIDWRRHGGWAFRSDIREAVCPGIESRLETGPFDPYLAFCSLFRKIQHGETDAARRDFERIMAADPFLARHAIQWSFRNDKQADWLIEPYLAGGDRDKVRRLAILIRQAETPEMLKIAANLHRKCGDRAEADALLAQAEKQEKD